MCRLFCLVTNFQIPNIFKCYPIICVKIECRLKINMASIKRNVGHICFILTNWQASKLKEMKYVFKINVRIKLDVVDTISIY